MRFDSSSNPPQPLAPSWRIILWAITLTPALLILGWSLRQTRLPTVDPAMQGRTEEEALRLKRILNEPRDDPSRLQDDAVRVVAGADESQPGTRESSATSAEDAQLDKSILAAIKDNTFGITTAEKPAYEAILVKVRNTPVEDLQRIAHTDVPFSVLMLDADRYRGDVVTLEGDLRRINRIAAAPNDSTTKDSWEVWLFTADSGLNPYRVILADLPDGVPQSDDLKPALRVRVTGYFFKRYSYATTNNFHTAPLLIGKMSESSGPATSHAQRPARNSRGLTLLAMGVFATFVIVAVVVEVSIWRRSRHHKASQEIAEPPPDMSWLNHDPH